MRTYVINLASSAERRGVMLRQLEARGLEYVFVNAVDGRTLTAEQRAELVDEREVTKYPHWLTPGAIGCALSHKRVLELIASGSDRAALVLEDDAILPEGIRELSESLGRELQPNEVILLNFRSFGACKLSRSNTAAIGNHQVLRPIEPRQLVSTLAYLISAGAAAALAEVIVPVRCAADSWGEHLESGVFGSVRVVLPRPVEQRLSGHSTIGFAGASSLRKRLARQTFWPIPALRIANRKRVTRQMQRVEFVD